MNQTEQLVLKVKAVEDMVGAALSPLAAAKRRIRAWLASKAEPSADVDGTIKTYLQITKATTATVTDAAAVRNQFEDLLRARRFTDAELLDLFRAGVLAVGDTAALVGAIGTKLPGYVAPTTVATTPAGDPAQSPLRFHVLAEGRYEGLKARIAGRHDLEAEVRRILAMRLEPAPAAPARPRAGRMAVR